MSAATVIISLTLSSNLCGPLSVPSAITVLLSFSPVHISLHFPLEHFLGVVMLKPCPESGTTLCRISREIKSPFMRDRKRGSCQGQDIGWSVGSIVQRRLFFVFYSGSFFVLGMAIISSVISLWMFLALDLSPPASMILGWHFPPLCFSLLICEMGLAHLLWQCFIR